MKMRREVVEFTDRVETCVNGLLHSVNGQPSVLYNNGGKEWHKQGVLHRDNDPNFGPMPAAKYPNGDVFYRKNGLLHRDDDPKKGPMPAVYHSNGTVQYFKDGVEYDLVIKDGTPTLIEHIVKPVSEVRRYTVNNNNGDIETLVNGKYHSIDDMPAITTVSGTKYWYTNGKLHRDDSTSGPMPAIEYKDGTKRYFKNGIEFDLTPKVDSVELKKLTKDEFRAELEKLQASIKSLMDRT